MMFILKVALIVCGVNGFSSTRYEVTNFGRTRNNVSLETVLSDKSVLSNDVMKHENIINKSNSKMLLKKLCGAALSVSLLSMSQPAMAKTAAASVAVESL